jgi:isopentenyl diphosphate isomerase/L-lactate dehydrogenase-like FMN-dependent dehydrogenase
MRADDGRAGHRGGADAIYVSNHGGRQLDHAPAGIEQLPAIMEAVAGRVPVLIDGGFMRGADIVKALALGADAVGIGKLQGLALAAGGEAGLEHCLALLDRKSPTRCGCLGYEPVSAAPG